MKYITHVYLHDGKPHAAITAVETDIGPPPSAGAPLSLFVRPISKDTGWVRYSGKVHETESDARVDAISKIDVLSAQLENLRESLVRGLHDSVRKNA